MDAASASSSSAPPLAVWRKLLKPWLAALRDAQVRVELPPLATVSDMRDLWVEVLAPRERRNNPGVWSLLIEAMEILELLSRVDHSAAWALVFELVGLQYTLEMYAAQLFPDVTEIRPRFLVRIDGEEIIDRTDDTAQSLIRLIIESEVVSPKYKRAKDKLLEAFREQNDGRDLDRETDGRVQLSLEFDVAMDFEDEGETGYVFTQLKQIAYAYHDPSLLVKVEPGAQGGLGDDDDDDDDDEENDQEEGDAARDEGAGGDRNGQFEGGEGNGENADTARAPGPGRTNSRNEDPDPTEIADAPPRGPFAIESFRFRLMEHPVSNILLYMINETGKLGMRMSDVTLSLLWHERLHHSVIGGFLLNQLAPWRGRRDDLGIENLKIDLGGFDAPGVRAFCTAIAHSGSLRTLDFAHDAVTEENAIQADGSVWWPWLAYALFSSDADHRIHTASLNVEGLEISHVQAIREVLDHTNPLAFLFQKVPGASANRAPLGPAMSASLNPSALLRLGHYRVIPADETDTPALRVREPGVTYQVVRDNADEDYIEILLPGTGVCWTERNELIALKPIARRERHGIRHLTLMNITNVAVPAVIELLDLIGEPLERLSLSSQEESMDSTLLTALRSSCRNVKRLDLISYYVDNFDWLCAPSSDSWRFETLRLQTVGAEDVDSYAKLFTTLSDSSSALTQSLRQLFVGVGVFNGDVKTRRLIALYADMLDKNHRLVRCEIGDCSKVVMEQFKERLLAHHNEPVCVEKGPLSTQQKLAFLSVVTPRDDERRASKQPKRDPHGAATTSAAMHKLDSPMVRSIMAMAATPERRISGIITHDIEMAVERIAIQNEQRRL